MGLFPMDKCVACGGSYYGQESPAYHYPNHCAELNKTIDDLRQSLKEEHEAIDKVVKVLKDGGDVWAAVVELASHDSSLINVTEHPEYYEGVSRIKANGKEYVWLFEAAEYCREKYRKK